MENKNILISLAKSILHPKKGLAYIEGENLKSFEDWQMYLENRKCLVLLNIEKKYINFFTNYKIGEVIPSGIHNLDIYNAGFCCRVISDFFEGKTKKKNYLGIFNYFSFKKINEIIINSIKEKQKFISSLKQVFSEIEPDNFWLYVPISDDVACKLEKENLGEIINNENKNLDNYFISINNYSKDYSENNEMECESDDSNEENTNEEPYYRVAMNEKTFLNFLRNICIELKIKDKKTNIYDSIKNFNEKLEDIFIMFKNINLA